MGYVVAIMVMIFMFWLAAKLARNETIQEAGGKEILDKIIDDKRRCSFYKDLKHLGGHPYFKSDSRVVFKVRDSNIYLSDYQMIKEIKLTSDNIIDYKIQSETEISKDVTIPRVLALGILALVAKKETKTTNQFLILTLIEKGIKIQCVFGQHSENDNLYDIITEINRFKIETVVV